MGFLNKIFGNSEAETTAPNFWKKMESEEDLNKAIEESFERKTVIFKHSTTCFISKMVLKNFEKEVGNYNKNISYYLLNLLSYRSLSNKIAEDFKVTHQSPQLIVLENGNMTNNASHQSISTDLI